MINELDSRSNGPGSSPGLGHCVVFLGKMLYSHLPLSALVLIVQRMDNAIHRINHYPVDSVICFLNTYPLDSNLSGG